MTGLFLSRARLRRDAPLVALARLLVPDAAAARAAAGHHLIWSLFADGPERQRDFLWREERPGEFLTLSARIPADPHGLFEVEHKAFEPVLSPGDRLGFALRANPTVARREPPRQAGERRGKRRDVVMDALWQVPRGEARAAARLETVTGAGRAWLARQGEAKGFRLLGEVSVDGYVRLCIPRKVPETSEGAARRKAGDAVFGVADFQGVLTVEDPARFLAAVGDGFGRARAFGCGLMLLRRAR